MRVLSLDGGGSKGFFTLEILRYLEMTCGCPIRECFDLIVGTSIGAFIAGCLVAGKTIDEIETEFLPQIRLFSKISIVSASRILRGHVLDASDWAIPLQTLLGNVQVQDLPKSPRLLIVAGDATSEIPHPYLIRSHPLPEEVSSRSPFKTTSSISLVDAIRAATAAPTIYPPHIHEETPIIDGGVVCNNPVFIALAEMSLLEKTLDCMVSIGTGVELRPPASIPVRGMLGWTWALMKRTMDSDTAADLARGILPPSQYFRFDPTGVSDCNTWESNPDVLRKARRSVQDYMHSHKETLATLVLRLFPQAQDNEDRSVSNAGRL